jgi:hypothetical protein
LAKAEITTLRKAHTILDRVRKHQQEALGQDHIDDFSSAETYLLAALNGREEGIDNSPD